MSYLPRLLILLLRTAQTIRRSLSLLLVRTLDYVKKFIVLLTTPFLLKIWRMAARVVNIIGKLSSPANQNRYNQRLFLHTVTLKKKAAGHNTSLLSLQLLRRKNREFWLLTTTFCAVNTSIPCYLDPHFLYVSLKSPKLESLFLVLEQVSSLCSWEVNLGTSLLSLLP